MLKIPHSKTGLITMPMRLLLIGFCVLAWTSLWADMGHVTITNCGTEKLWVGSYNWGDTLLATAYESDIYSVGDQHTLHCRKNAFTKDSPGCYIKVKYSGSDGIKLGHTRVDNGIYTLGTIKDDAECGTNITVCLKEQTECATAPSISSNTSDCLWRADAGITGSCPH